MSTKTVVITGAAAGIGRATALRFARAGYVVGAFDIDVAGLTALRTLAESEGLRVHTGTLDVTDPEDWDTRLAEFTAQTGGQLHVLVNNAGVLSAGRFEEMSVQTHKRMVDINLLGTIYGCRAAYPYLKSTPESQVVNLCSASAIYGQPELATYGASKFAVRGLTEALDLEWRRDGIRVLAMWPLFVKTGMLEGVATGSTGSLGVRLTPDDVAEEIFADVNKKPGLVPQVHFPVGAQAKALFASAKFSPWWILREVNRRISRA